MKIDTLTLGPVQTNCYIVYNEGSGQAVIIDPAGEPEKITKALEGKTPKAVLLTHGHFDHTGALSAFADVPVYIHPADAEMLNDSRLSAGYLIGDDAPRPAATDFVQEGAKLCLAGLNIEVMHLPGHTPGSVAYRIGDVLFTGDTLFCRGYGRTDLPGGSMAEELRSIRRLLRPDKDFIVCPGHGEATTLRAEREYFL